MMDGLGRHPLLDALWASLPPAGSPWPVSEQAAWLRVAAAVLPLVYPPARHPEPPHR